MPLANSVSVTTSAPQSAALRSSTEQYEELLDSVPALAALGKVGSVADHEGLGQGGFAEQTIRALGKVGR